MGRLAFGAFPAAQTVGRALPIPSAHPLPWAHPRRSPWARFRVRVTVSGGRASRRAATPVGNRRLSRSFALPDCTLSTSADEPCLAGEAQALLLHGTNKVIGGTVIQMIVRLDVIRTSAPINPGDFGGPLACLRVGVAGVKTLVACQAEPELTF